MAWRGKARHGFFENEKDKSNSGEAGRGLARHGEARHGFFENEKEKDKRFRWVRHGMAARGEAGQGEVSYKGLTE